MILSGRKIYGLAHAFGGVELIFMSATSKRSAQSFTESLSRSGLLALLYSLSLFLCSSCGLLPL